MIRFFRYLIAFAVIIVLPSCTTYNRFVPIEIESKDVFQPVDSDFTSVTLEQFEKDATSPMDIAALDLFNKIVQPEDRDDYGVMYFKSERFVEKRRVDIFCYDFLSISSNYAKPTLHVVYNASHDGEGVNFGHNQLVAISEFRQKTNLRMIKKNFSDSTAIFSSKEYGPNLEFVTRAIDGKQNITALIRLSDNLDQRTFTSEEMISRVQTLTKDDFVPKAVDRYRVNEDLRDLNVEYTVTLHKREDGAISCENCRKVCENSPEACHIEVKFDRNAENATYTLEQFLSEAPLCVKKGSIDADIPVTHCFNANCLLPAESMIITVTDSNGQKIESFTFSPKPIIVKSNVDDAFIQAELITKDLYLISTNKVDEDFDLESCSHKEFIKGKFKEKTLFVPGVKDLGGGVAELKFFRESGEYLKLCLPWGNEIKRQSQILANNQKR